MAFAFAQRARSVASSLARPNRRWCAGPAASTATPPTPPTGEGFSDTAEGGSGGGGSVPFVRSARYDELVLLSGQVAERLPSEYAPWDAEVQQWVLRYGWVPEKLGDGVRGLVRTLEPDAEVEQWLRNCLRYPVGTLQQRLLLLLYKRMYYYSAQVLFNAPHLFLLSPEQWARVLPRDAVAEVQRSGGTLKVLDVGAGKGDLVNYYSPVLGDGVSVVCTEVSAVLCHTLRRRRGVEEAFNTEEVDVPADEYRLALCLNTLDRCRDPTILLRQLRASLSTQSVAVIALPLPWCHLDFIANTAFSALDLEGSDGTFETSCEAVVSELLLPAGFKPREIFRAPYLSSGPKEQPIAQVLDTAIFVCDIMYV